MNGGCITSVSVEIYDGHGGRTRRLETVEVDPQGIREIGVVQVLLKRKRSSVEKKDIKDPVFKFLKRDSLTRH